MNCWAMELNPAQFAIENQVEDRWAPSDASSSFVVVIGYV